jgi:hypothetical protein
MFITPTQIKIESLFKLKLLNGVFIYYATSRLLGHMGILALTCDYETIFIELMKEFNC